MLMAAADPLIAELNLAPTSPGSGAAGDPRIPHPLIGHLERIQRVVSDNAIVIFSLSSCCLCHVAKKLFCSMGVSPTVVELDEDAEFGADVEDALARLVGGSPAVPAVFVGGKLIGGLDDVMACHISGALIPQLKAAGALWL